MTIDEAIAHIRNEANSMKQHAEILCCTQDFFSDIEYHEQIAEWLAELKEYKEEVVYKEYYEQGKQDGYNMAIDDFVNACKEDILCQSFGLRANGIERIAEQLKAGGIDGNERTNA